MSGRDSYNTESYKNMFYKIVRQRYPNKESDAYIQPLVDDKWQRLFCSSPKMSNVFTVMWNHSVWSEIAYNKETMAKQLLVWWHGQFSGFDATEEQVALFLPYVETFSFFCQCYFE